MAIYEFRTEQHVDGDGQQLQADSRGHQKEAEGYQASAYDAHTQTWMEIHAKEATDVVSTAQATEVVSTGGDGRRQHRPRRRRQWSAKEARTFHYW